MKRKTHPMGDIERALSRGGARHGVFRTPPDLTGGLCLAKMGKLAGATKSLHA
jgi:hypothetical protein